jgi:hypothetical protein
MNINYREIEPNEAEIEEALERSKRAVDRGDFRRATIEKYLVAALLRQRGDYLYATDVAEAQAAYFMAGAVESAARELEKKVR